MKILHVASGFDIRQRGGVPNYVRATAAAQVAAGDSVVVLDGADHAGLEVMSDGVTRLSLRGTQYRDRPLQFAYRDDQCQEILECIRGIGPDIVHVQQTLCMPLAFYEKLHQLNIPYVVSLHDYYLYCPRITMVDYTGNPCGGPSPDKCSNCVSKLETILPLYRASRKLDVEMPRFNSRAVLQRNAIIASFLSRASAVIAVSDRVRALFASVYPDCTYVVEHVGSESANTPTLKKTESPAIRVAMLGTLDKYKGAEVFARLVRAVDRQDMTFVFYGRVHSRWGAELESAGVELLGPYDPADLPQMATEIDLGFVLPIWEDNAPQVVMEFLNNRIPVLATRRGGIPDFIDDSNGVLFDPDDVSEFDTVVARLQSLAHSDLETWRGAIKMLLTPSQHTTALKKLYLAAHRPSHDVLAPEIYPVS